ncbi:glycoside hydrolase family 2 TIM barrel-domain containing protein [Corynebacterium uterequi]|uniref:beta-galactosidase n=1 Tax=Corynebacterium uterequi TaxID=1072256 RepID=A0A0G3H9S2_9CORY|nr:glycoside hydrolase family 2 TIM barrel-domain containing protein [Corynebacterium uterequi]AKK10084.1 beta-galactosidase/beta-glucuronidase [Corynebacterium uterequi]
MSSNTPAIHPVTSLAPGTGHRVPPRSYLRTDADVLSLNGQWKFKLGPTAAGPDADAPWETIEVPSHWVLAADDRYGQPWYTNIEYPFPVDPPFVPDDNPTADYQRSFPFSPRPGHRYYLRTQGIESLAIIRLNDAEVGTVAGSRLAQELDITEHLREGDNILDIRVHQWSAHTYLEDQDQWWLPGIFRDVEILTRPDGGIEDVWVRADFDLVTGHGILDVELRTENFPVTLSVPELGVTEEIDAPTARIEVGKVQPWSADVPRLYDVTLANSAETITLRTGFRRVEIRGAQWLVNGKKLRLRGVNRHEFHPEKGRVFDAADARAGLCLMKRANINAIRFSHYPPHPELVAMCDELGFWVIDECDLETHGFWLCDWRDNPSDDPRWRDAYLDRVERFVERDKNHPCIIAWSLGNESGTGANLAAMSAWIHARDPHRPVHYEGDHEGSYTDIVSRMYLPIEGMEDLSQGVGPRSPEHLESAGRYAALAQRPMIQCEYAHAMGNGPGALREYEAAFSTLPQWHGGFVWEWRDHGLARGDFYAYGSDFDQDFSDGSFVCDGLVLSDGTPSPGLHDLAAIITPIPLEIHQRQLTVTNLRHDGDTSDLVFNADGLPFDVPVLLPGESAVVELPGGRWSPVVTVELKEDTAWAPAGHVLTTAQELAEEQPSPVPRGAEPLSTATAARIDADGLLASATLAGPRLTLYRAPTENDRLSGFGTYLEGSVEATRGAGVPGPSNAERWHAQRLHLLRRRVLSVTRTDTEILAVHRYAPPSSDAWVDVTLRWREVDGQLLLDAAAVPNSRWKDIWARLGLEFTLPNTGPLPVRWYGTGPGENYPDACAAAFVDEFAGEASGLITDYAVPQESGHRADLRRLTLPDVELTTYGPRPGFSLRAHDERTVAAARHSSELPESDTWHLVLDVAQHGIGTRSCGPDVLPAYHLRPRSGEWHLGLRL